jgi:hypothetical protein
MRTTGLMIKPCAVMGAVILLLMSLSAGRNVSAEEAGQQLLNRARSTVKNSSLGKEDKLRLLSAADRAVAAGIPQEDAAVIISRAMERNVAGSGAAAFLEMAAQLRELGLPSRLVLDRIEQGLAKGVPTERISAVVRNMSAALADARPLVQSLERAGLNAGSRTASENAVETVARALEKSISPDAMVHTGNVIREHNGSMALFARAVDTTTTFVGSGMAAEQASRLVQNAMSQGYSERDLEAMERYMVDELRKNRPIRDIGSGMESRMDRGGMGGGFDRQGGGQFRGPGSGGMGGPGMGGRR